MENPDVNNLEQVRDILFGAQTRELTLNLERIKDQLAKDTTAARKDAKSRTDSLEALVKNEVRSLLDHIKTEKEHREQAVTDLGKQIKELGREVKGLISGLDKRLTKLDEKLAKSGRSQRQQLLDEVKSLRDDLEIKYDQQSDALEREAAVLREVTVDRATLGELLTDVALRLTNQRDLPKKG